MDKGSISRVTGIGEELINEDIQSRIDEIEAAGYRYEQTETINLSTKQNTVGSLGHFEPDDYDKIKGEDLTVMTFVGDDQQKRYCIIDSDHEVVRKALSTLREYSEYVRSQEVMDRVKYAEELSKAFQDLGMDLSGKELFHCIEQPPHDTPPYYYARDIVMDYKVNILDMPDSPKNVSHEWSCGMDRQYDINQALCSFTRQGLNSSEQQYITDVTKKMGGQIIERVLEDEKDMGRNVIIPDFMIPADQAKLFGVEDRAFERIKDMVIPEPDRAEEFLKDYTAELNRRTKRTLHPSIIKVLADTIRKDPDALIPKRVNHDLQNLANHIHRSSDDLGISKKEAQKAVKNMIQQYTTDDRISYRNLDQGLRIEKSFPQIDEIQKTNDMIHALAEGKPLADQIGKEPEGISEKTAEIYQKKLDDFFRSDCLGQKEGHNREEMIVSGLQHLSGLDIQDIQIDGENRILNDVSVKTHGMTFHISKDVLAEVNAAQQAFEQERDQIAENIFQKIESQLDPHYKSGISPDMSQEQLDQINEALKECNAKLTIYYQTGEIIAEMKDGSYVSITDTDKWKDQVKAIEEPIYPFDLEPFQESFCRTEEHTFGVSFDNAGGEKQFYYKDTLLMTEPGFKDSFGESPEEEKWARNSFTNFNDCMKDQDFINYCRDHQEAIEYMATEGITYPTEESFKDRVDSVEEKLDRAYEELALDEQEWDMDR